MHITLCLTVEECSNKNGDVVNILKLNEDVIEIINQGLKECYLYGTTKYIFDETLIADVIAKTGTGSGYDDENRSPNNYIGWVNLFYPSFNPDFNLMVIVKKGGSSSACKVASVMLKYFKKR